MFTGGESLILPRLEHENKQIFIFSSENSVQKICDFLEKAWSENRVVFFDILSSSWQEQSHER